MEKRRGTKHQNQVLAKPGFNFVGFPDDLGVKNVNGRLGAREGPRSFLEAFQKLNGRNPVRERLREISFVEMSDEIESNHESAARTVADLHRANPKDVLVAVGGGNDYSYSWFKGWQQACNKSSKKKPKISCINIDAHFDLRDYRPVMTSGSPFRRLLEEKILDGASFVEFGIQSHCNAEELWRVAKKYKVKTVPFTVLRDGKAIRAFKAILKSLTTRCDEVLISVDLDALSYAFAPGVSAPQAEGFTGGELLQIMEIAGSDKKVTSLGIFELSPSLDFQNYTSRLAAQAAWHFLDSKLF
ncbi:MAG: formimidoylglutamase [Bdellovibrionales bacterium]|nr:formimidoylglutamase [Bdellovibrionales bacterium]